MMKSFWKPTAAIAAVALLGTMLVANFVRADEKAASAAIGATAPQFTLKDQTGKSVSLSDYAGKIVVLEWTNPECPIVRRHYKAKTMTTLQAQYKPQDIVWLAINSTGTATNEKNAAWVAANKMEYPVLNDSTGEIGHAYGAKTTPDMYIIDKTGKLVYSGAIDDDKDGDKTTKVNYVSKALDELLAGKTVSTSETTSYGCAVHYAN
jgi:peroxiredoxin